MYFLKLRLFSILMLGSQICSALCWATKYQSLRAWVYLSGEKPGWKEEMNGDSGQLELAFSLKGSQL